MSTATIDITQSNFSFRLSFLFAQYSRVRRWLFSSSGRSFTFSQGWDPWVSLASPTHHNLRIAHPPRCNPSLWGGQERVVFYLLPRSNTERMKQLYSLMEATSPRGSLLLHTQRNYTAHHERKIRVALTNRGGVKVQENVGQ